MIIKWFGQGTIEAEQLTELGIQYTSMIVGQVKTGETEEDWDDEGNPIISEIRKPGVAIGFPATPSDEVLERIDLILPLCKREGGRDFPTAVSMNLDLRVANPQKAAFKLSQLYGLTQEQLADYIQNQIDSITSLAEAKAVLTPLLQKMAALELWLAKQTRLDE